MSDGIESSRLDPSSLSSAPKLGGQPKLRLLLVGGDELIDLVASTRNGGSKLESGLQEKVAAAYDGRFEVVVTYHPGGTMSDLYESLSDTNGDPDVVLVSVLADVLGKGRFDVSAFEDAGHRVARMLKDRGAHVVFANVSTVDPRDLVTNYFGLPDDPPSLRAHKAALAIIDLSNQLGISVLDADRLLAEMGAAQHVVTIGRYSSQASDALCDEIKRILEDYGFFENRPLMVQSGKRGPT